jgi:hypothetical protein
MLDFGRGLCDSQMPSLAAWFVGVLFLVCVCCDMIALSSLYFGEGDIEDTLQDVEALSIHKGDRAEKIVDIVLAYTREHELSLTPDQLRELLVRRVVGSSYL